VQGTISLRPNESRTIFISAVGRKAGVWSGGVRVSDGRQTETVPLTVQTAPLHLPDQLRLHAVNWGYLSLFKLIRDRQQSAIADLQAHHTSVVVVPPQLLPSVSRSSQAA
jgi:hypothetical protein